MHTYILPHQGFGLKSLRGPLEPALKNVSAKPIPLPHL
jgi:hypothetical protein